MATKNHNFRFNVEKEEEKRAWDLLHSKEVEQGFKSQNEFVMKAINDYYDRHLKKKDDPYLETREKEQEFTNRTIEAVQGSVFANLPALVGMYFMGQQNFSLPVMNGVISPAVATANLSNNGSTEVAGKPIGNVGETIKESGEELLEAEELPDNDFLDTDAW